MPRNPELEALLQAQYDLEGAPADQKAARLEDQRRLLIKTLEAYNRKARSAGHPEITREQLLEALWSRYKEFKRKRDLEIRRIMSRAYRQ